MGVLKGGLGTAPFDCGNFMIGAIAAANPLGSVLIPGTKNLLGLVFGVRR